MAKEKKSKVEKTAKAEKKLKKAKKAEATSNKAAKAPKSPVSKAAEGVKALTQNPLVADVVAAALVSMAAALKDNKKAHALADNAGAELKTLSGKAGKDGQVMWDLAKEVGRQALDAIVSEQKKGDSKGKKSA